MSNASEDEVHVRAHRRTRRANNVEPSVCPQRREWCCRACDRALHEAGGGRQVDPWPCSRRQETSFVRASITKAVAAGKMWETVTPDGGFAGFVYAKKSKPWIAAVQGPAAGGGVEIALSCDIVVASEAASFALPEVKRGLIAGAGGAYRITRCSASTPRDRDGCDGRAVGGEARLRGWPGEPYHRAGEGA